MFSFRRPSATQIARQIEETRQRPPFEASYLAAGGELKTNRLPLGFARDFTRSSPGEGKRVFESAKLAFRRWLQFDLGWVRVANPEASIEAGQIVAVEVISLGLWSLNLSRVVETVDREDCFGFVYATTEMHVEEGEERFLLRFERDTGRVSYELEAMSRPRNPCALLGYPITRYFQHRFARDSHGRTRAAIYSGSIPS